MRISVSTPLQALDGSKEQGEDGRNVLIPVGEHEVEEILNPGRGCPWLVLKGTKIGASRPYVLSHTGKFTE